ncbi:MAG: GntR family transcriptional regulator [Verrucomicrobia bacterium]|nr:GntR family transcriptional regulator [Verrucomicrobiota bacterium]
MLNPLSSIKVDHTVVSYRHIRDRLRETILSGRLAPAAKLPSTQDLAALWRVDVGTVHAALTPLVKEGLLIRQLRKGTFVRERKRNDRLTTVGIYYAQNIWAPNFSFFLQALHEALQRELELLNVRAAVCLDSRPMWQHRQPWNELADMARTRQVQAVIAPSAGWGRARWLSRLPVPTVMFTTDRVPHRITTDTRQAVDLALRAIAKQGCRSVGLIYPGNPNVVSPLPGVRNVDVDFLEAFADLSRQHRLEIRNPWMRIAHTEESSQRWDEKFGYEQFHELWRQPSHPDGLVVFPDTAVRGVITAALEARVKIPDDLKLVLHKNAEVSLLCPFPATFAVFNVTAAAKAAMAMIQQQLRGEPCESVMIPHTLETPRTSPTATPLLDSIRHTEAIP